MVTHADHVEVWATLTRKMERVDMVLNQLGEVGGILKTMITVKWQHCHGICENCGQGLVSLPVLVPLKQDLLQVYLGLAGFFSHAFCLLVKSLSEWRILKILTWKTIRFRGRIYTPVSTEDTFLPLQSQGSFSSKASTTSLFSSVSAHSSPLDSITSKAA